jgi:hypothetical protein
MAGPVAEFMQGRAMPVDRLEIALGTWDLDVVERRRVECLVAAKPQVGAAGADQRLDLGNNQPSGTGGATAMRSSGRPSHCAALKTVNRLRNGMAMVSSPVSRERRRSSSGTKRSA